MFGMILVLPMCAYHPVGASLNARLFQHTSLQRAMALTNEDPNQGVVLKERYMLCPSCGNFAHYSQKQVFCIFCGEKLIEECPDCREPIIYPIAKFCPACGTGLVKGGHQTPNEQKKIDHQQ